MPWRIECSSDSRSELILGDLTTNRVQIPSLSDIRQACKRELGGFLLYPSNSTVLGSGGLSRSILRQIVVGNVPASWRRLIDRFLDSCLARSTKPIMVS